jgi:hypothetical protein
MAHFRVKPSGIDRPVDAGSRAKRYPRLACPPNAKVDTTQHKDGAVGRRFTALVGCSTEASHVFGNILLNAGLVEAASCPNLHPGG